MKFSAVTVVAAAAIVSGVEAQQQVALRPAGGFSVGGFLGTVGSIAATVFGALEGNMVHQSIPLPANAGVAPTRKERRDASGITSPFTISCDGTTPLPAADVTSAFNILASQCGDGTTGMNTHMQSNVDMYVGSGKDTIVYICNFETSSTQKCFSKEATDTQARLASQCGANVAGYINSANRQIRYGLARRSDIICRV